MDKESFQDIVNQITIDYAPEQIKHFQWLHQHPELAYQEFESGKYIANYLETLDGLEVIYPFAKTGVKAVLKGENSEIAVAIRADFDALPVKEDTGLSYASRSKGTYNGQETYVSHVCGHDASAATAMGTATVLNQLKDDLNGDVVFLFQPAEEGVPDGMKAGADLMVSEGALKNPDVSAIFALHPYSKAHPGTVLLSKNTTHAGLNDLVIKIKGVQAHGSMPWVGRDPIVAGAAIINSLQTIVSREADLMRGAAVVTVGYFHGGIKVNIIPDHAEMGLTIRALDEKNLKLLVKRVTEITKLVSKAHGCEAEIIMGQHDPMNKNDPDLCKNMLNTIRQVAGESNMIFKPATTGSEDFSYFSNKVPGLYLHFGTAPQNKPISESRPNHHPGFMVDDDALKFATKLECCLLHNYLKQRSI
ncbi:MAG: amidohydrolase [Methanobacterium sp. ERen5]|nr:MAG: amidohydrolase [Methanobacterium sp. ERen5]